MASISGRGAKGHHTYKLTLTEASTSTPNNTSSINYSFDLIDDANWFWEQWGSSITYSISANGSVIKSGSIPNHTTKNQTIASGSFTVPHNADGTKTISYSFTVTDGAGQSYTSGNASASGTMALTKIPRYATVTQTLSNKTETTINVNWSSDSTIDYIWVSIDNGSTWKGYDVTDGKSGTYSLSSLSANTTYKIKTRVRRKDSQLTTDSSALSVTTYAYPYCTKAPDFMIGDAVKLEFYNPLGRSFKWYLGLESGVTVASGTTTGTSVSVSYGATGGDKLYAHIPNSQKGDYIVNVTYSGNTSLKSGGKFYITGMEIPSIKGVTYYDSNSTTVAITGNNQHIVQNKSNLKIQVAEASTTFGAGSIEQYSLTYNGKVKISLQAGTFDLGVIDSSKNITVELQVRDSRGMIAKKTFTVTMLAHSSPSATVTLERLNNYEDETYLTVDGSISSVNSKNTMAIKYRYKQSGGSYGSYATTTDRQKNTLSLDKNNSYIFEVVVTDAFGSTFTKEYVLNKGVFPLFIDTEKNSVGINCFPANEKSLEVNGLDISTIKEITKSLKLTANTWADVGINGQDLQTGTYIMQVWMNDNSTATGQWNERMSGILTWFEGSTNSGDVDNIPVTRAGHSRNSHNIQFRVARTTNSGRLKLQMCDSIDWSGNSNVIFSFKRLL